jgi:hypothetical protein
MARILALALLLPLLAACGGGPGGIDPTKDQVEAAQQQKNCKDPKWKEAHLGIWYNVCRPNDAMQLQ